MSKKETEIRKSSRQSKNVFQRFSESRFRNIYLIVILIVFIITPITIAYIVNPASFSGIQPPSTTVSGETTGYATFNFYYIDEGNETEYNVYVALIDYDTLLTYDTRWVNSSTVLQIENTTLLYSLDTNATSFIFKNVTFIIYCSQDSDNPNVNICNLMEKTESGDLEVHLYDLDFVRGEYDVSDLTLESHFILNYTSLTNIKTIGLSSYIPPEYQLIDNIYNALWLETDGNITNFTYNNVNYTVHENDGLYYIQLSAINMLNSFEYPCSIIFETLPTYFKFYDGIPIPSDLLLTLN